MSGKKLFSFWCQSPHLNHCSVSSALPWPWLLLHSPLSDDLIVMMVSHLVSDLLLVSCVLALDGPPGIHTHPPIHTHIRVHSKAPCKCHVIPLYIPFKWLQWTSHFHFLCPWDLGRMNTPSHSQWQPFASRTSEQMRWVHVPTWYKLSSF